MMNTNSFILKSLKLGLPCVLAIGCGGAPIPSNELVAARQAYEKARTGLAAKYNPAQLHDAADALADAEQAFANAPEEQRSNDLAYVAERKALTAEAEASARVAKERKETAQKKVNKAAFGALSKTKSALAKTEAELQAEKRARVEAEERAKVAMERLKESLARYAEVAEDAKRGTVITLSGSVIFKSGSAILTDGAKERLVDVANALKDSMRDIIVEGHTDSRGKESTNQSLSEQRAQSVLAFLVANGVPADKIKAVGFGSSRPVADNSSREGRANNRRVEIVVSPAEDK